MLVVGGREEGGNRAGWHLDGMARGVLEQEDDAVALHLPGEADHLRERVGMRGGVALCWLIHHLPGGQFTALVCRTRRTTNAPAAPQAQRSRGPACGDTPPTPVDRHGWRLDLRVQVAVVLGQRTLSLVGRGSR